MQTRELMETILFMPPHLTSKLDKHQQYSLVAPLMALRISLGFAVAFWAVYRATGVGKATAHYALVIGGGVSIVFSILGLQLVVRNQEKGVRNRRDRARACQV